MDDIAESMKGVADEVVESVLENTVWRWRGIWHARCVLKRMLPMFGDGEGYGMRGVF